MRLVFVSDNKIGNNLRQTLQYKYGRESVELNEYGKSFQKSA